jgi:solute:Na+ symporter, SSS family
MSVLKKSVGNICLWLAVLLGGSSVPGQDTNRLSIRQLHQLPQSVGVAGPFCGLVDDQLVVAGGANFPLAMPWEGGEKVWHDDLYLLDSPTGNWKVGPRLPQALGYGVSITIPQGMLLIGGSNATKHFANVYLLEKKQTDFRFRELAPLPTPLANTSGALIANQVIVVGGAGEPGEQSASNRVFSLDLGSDKNRNLDGQWTELEPLPGPGRLLVGIAALGDQLYVFGGAAIVEVDGKPRRLYLKNGFRRAIRVDGRRKSSWQPMADLPFPLVATPTPSPAIGPNHFLVCGGDDGRHVGFEPVSDHPGFNGTCWVYHSVTNTWAESGRLEAPAVTTQIVPWYGDFVIPSGEVRPGVRTAAVTSLSLHQKATSFGVLNYATLAVYLLAVFGVGLFAAGEVVNTNQFFRAGQSIPWWAAGLSIFATMLSSITFMSIPAQGFSVGWNLFVSSIYVLLTPLIVYVYVPFFRRLDVTSAYQYLELRFNVAVRLFASMQFILFQLGRIAVVLFLPSLALSTVAGINLSVSVVAVGVLCVFYTMFGGMKAVIWTDVVQAIILLGGAIAAMAAIIWKVPGGVGQIFSVANEGQKLLHTLSWTWDTSIATAWTIMIGSLFTNLFSYSASQDVVQRYLTTKDEKTAGRAIWVNAILSPVAQAIFFCIGTGLFAFYFTYPHELNPRIANDSIFPFFVVNELPAGVAGLIIAAVFAASQSTISSSLNSLATAVVTDFYRRFQPNASDKSALKLARYTTLLAGLIGIALALLLAKAENIRSLWELFLAVLSLFGGSVSGLFVLGMFTTRANGFGAIVGAMASMAIVMLMFFSGVLFWWYSVVGVLACLAVGYLVSLAAPRKTIVENLTIYSLKPRL